MDWVLVVGVILFVVAALCFGRRVYLDKRRVEATIVLSRESFKGLKSIDKDLRKVFENATRLAKGVHVQPYGKTETPIGMAEYWIDTASEAVKKGMWNLSQQPPAPAHLKEVLQSLVDRLKAKEEQCSQD